MAALIRRCIAAAAVVGCLAVASTGALGALARADPGYDLQVVAGPPTYYGGDLEPVALSADGTTLVASEGHGFFVGSGGGITIYRRQASGFSLISTWYPNNYGDLDSTGASVAVSANGNIVVVGSSGFPTQGNDYGPGAAFVLRRTGNEYRPVATLTGPTAGGSEFGSSVAVSADGGTVLVGAINENAQAGAAYLFESDQSGVYRQIAYWTPPSTTPGTEFGAGVALSGDGRTALVGAPGFPEGQSSPGAGAGFVFTKSSGWQQSQTLSAQDGEPGDFFGWSLALDADGSTALIGAWGHLQGSYGVGHGAAYVFQRSGSSFAQSYEISAADGANGDTFGESVGLSADGITAVIGAPGRTIAGAYQGGAVYVFAQTGNSYSQTAEFSESSPPQGESFGYSVGLDGPANIFATNSTSLTQYGAVSVYTVTGSLATPTVALGITPTSSTYGGTVQANAQVTSSGYPSGSVDFWDGDPFSTNQTATFVGESAITNGTASVSTNVLGDGTHHLFATYSGDAATGAGEASTDETVDSALLHFAVSETIPFGGQPHLAPVYPQGTSVVYSGFVNGDGPDRFTGSMACDYGLYKNMAVGTYGLTCEPTDGFTDPTGDYSFFFDGGTLTITRAPLTITAASPVVTFGKRLTLGWGANFPPDNGPSSLNHQPTCTAQLRLDGHNHILSPAGEYAASCAGAVDPNYSFSYLPGTVTVVPAKPVFIYHGPRTIHNGKPATLLFSITGAGNLPLTGKRLSITVGTGSGVQKCATKPSSKTGVASCRIGTINQGSGRCLLTVSYAGDPSSANFYRATTEGFAVTAR